MSAVNCPRCATELKDLTLESSVVKACPKCEGTWYPDEALGQVTDHSLSELQQTELSPSLVADKLSEIDLEKAIKCPQCDKEMARYTYSLTCQIVLDECPEHGVWLDDGELGTLMSYLTDLDQRVGERQEQVLEARNLEKLRELSKSPTFYSLPSNVLATINNVYTRDR